MKLSAFLPPWGPEARPDDFDRVASAVDASGFDCLWIGDHVAFPRSVASSYPYNDPKASPFDPDAPHFEPFGLLGYLAARTQRVRLGVSVLVLPMRNPVESAKVLAGVDLLSRGRLVVGVGAGWMEEEFRVLGSDFATRGPRTDECISILRGLWTGESEALAGQHYFFEPLGFAPRPGPIPILVGGNTPAAMRRAARLGDGWHALRLPPGELAEGADRVRGLRCQAKGGADGFLVVTRDSLIDPAVARAGPPERDEFLAGQVLERLDRYR
ncbi:MAG: TIGR03619 family F420-dependent LLM class oxidoreductase, partial [Actinobacteria bacterium]|nr:TIGR03619 family F420-dependent LLM class oxidoreductase [Actinomycetota bacterium]